MFGLRIPQNSIHITVSVILLTAILFLGLVGLWRAILALWPIPDQVDFATYYIAAAILNTDQPVLYQEDLLLKTASACNVPDFAPPYVYPPFFASMLRPLALLPYEVAKNYWFWLNISCLTISFLLLLSVTGYPVKARYLALGALAIVIFPPVHLALLLGQVSPLLLLLCTGALYFASGKGALPSRLADSVAGLLLGLATMVKVFPIVFLPYMVLKRRFGIAFWMILTLLICLFLGVVWGGGIGNTIRYFGVVLPSVYRQRLDIAREDNQSLSAFFMRLFTVTALRPALFQDNIYSITLSPIIDSIAIARFLTYASSALITLSTFAVISLNYPSKAAQSTFILGFSLVSTLPLMIVSSVWFHFYVLLLLPLFVTLSMALKRDNVSSRIMFLVIYLCLLLQRYSNWWAVLTRSAWLLAFGLYGTLLLWVGLLYKLIGLSVEGQRRRWLRFKPWA